MPETSKKEHLSMCRHGEMSSISVSTLGNVSRRSLFLLSGDILPVVHLPDRVPGCLAIREYFPGIRRETVIFSTPSS